MCKWNRINSSDRIHSELYENKWHSSISHPRVQNNRDTRYLHQVCEYDCNLDRECAAPDNKYMKKIISLSFSWLFWRLRRIHVSIVFKADEFGMCIRARYWFKWDSFKFVSRLSLGFFRYTKNVKLFSSSSHPRMKRNVAFAREIRGNTSKLLAGGRVQTYKWILRGAAMSSKPFLSIGIGAQKLSRDGWHADWLVLVDKWTSRASAFECVRSTFYEHS